MVTTLGSYATAPISSTSAVPTSRIEQSEAADGPAHEVEQGVGGGGHNPGGPGVTEAALDTDLLAEGGPAAHLHGQVGHVDGGFARRRLHFEHPHHGVLAAGLDGGQGVGEKDAAGI